ncbi:MAG: dihydrolipoyl dehydrogenase [Magnetococcales bacterium]|nr:dihydrolipoyl dehydrogenase [Magnetococcales bacterium]
MSDKRWDLIVLGAGPGGYVAAIRASQLGLRTLCIDRNPLPGGTCLHRGCIPSKALLESSRFFANVRDAATLHGVVVPEPSLDLAAMMQRKQGVVDRLSKGIQGLFKRNGVTHLTGTARILESGKIQISESDGSVREEESARILVATGSRSIDLPMAPFDGGHIIDSSTALTLDRVPKHLIVIGAGVIGLEMATIWRRLGADVTIIEALPEILPGVDPVLIRNAKRLFRKQGLVFATGQRLIESRVEAESDKVMVWCENDKGERTEYSGDKVLVSVGRKPNLEESGLRQLGIACDPSGRVIVDDDFQTSLPGIYSIGDITPGPMLAHKASEEAIVAVERMAGKESRIDHDLIPSVVYCQPEIAMVGMTESDAKALGRAVNTGQFPLLASGRAQTAADADGIIRIVADAESDEILGVQILGREASELIASATVAIRSKMTSRQLAETIVSHPSLAETLKEAALLVTGKAIHL